MSARTIHPFPARMAPTIALDRLAAAPRLSDFVVLDPMCGSGTTLSAASEMAHRAIGFDVDPLAVLMSQVATSPVDIKALLNSSCLVLESARTSKSAVPPWNDDETNRFAEFWFDEPQRIQLSRLCRAINGVDDRSIRRALQVAVSRIIVTKSPRASLAADASHSRPHKVKPKSDYDVYEGFEKSIRNLASLLQRRKLLGDVSVDIGDARNLPLQTGSIDLVITSPPYLNAIDYLRGHRLSLIWFGHSVQSLRSIRSSSIGSERALDTEVLNQTSEIMRKIEDTVHNVDTLPSSSLQRYAQDLVLSARELYRVAKAGAQVVTVIGNSTRKGNLIRNDKVVRLAYEHAGFTYIGHSERQLPENKRYLPIRTVKQDSSMLRRMRSEIVLEVQKT